jgi:lipopolysaccharide export system protein LptA
MLRLAWPRALRTLLAVSLVLVVAVILVYFVSHRRRPTVVPRKAENIPAEQVEKQEGIEHIDFRGDRIVQVKAGTWYKGEDGLFHLENNVEVRDLAKKGGKEVFITGDRVTYDKDWSRARLEGKAKVRYGDLVFESASFDYEKSADVLSTDAGVVFSSPRISGHSRRMTYSFKDETIVLVGDAGLEARDESENASPLVVSGGLLTYRRLERTGRGEESVEFSLGESRGEAETVDFRMTDDEQYLLTLNLKGTVRARLVEEKSEGADNLLFDRTRELTAGEMDLRAFLNMNKIHSVEARGGCSLDTFTPSGRRLRVRSADMKLVFDRWGGLREFWAVKQANLVERGEASRIEQTISGGEIYIEGQGDMLRARAPLGGEARVDSPEMEVTGREIKLFPRSEDVSASGNVKLLFKPQAKGGESVGFFSSSQPAMAAAGAMSYQKGAHRLIIGDGMRMWQGRQTLSGDQLTMERETGAVQGTGGIRAVFPQTSKKEPAKEGRLEVGGESLTFNPKDRLLTFEKACWLMTENVDLKAGQIAVKLEDNQGTIQTIEARTSVVILSGLREGRGNAAFYDLARDTVELTGNPTLMDKEKGMIEGDKLTFYLGDGRIHVENRDRERSVTVIKF